MTKTTGRITILVLTLTLIFTSAVSSFASTVGDRISYTSSHAGSGAGQVAVFKVTGDSSWTGCCAEQGVDNGSGTATIDREPSAKVKALLYKYAIEMDWWSGQDATDVEVARAALRGHGSNVQYANITPRRLVEAIAQIGSQGKSSWKSAITGAGGWPEWEADLVIDWYDSLSTSGISVPSSFEIFYCDAGNNQDFMIWRFSPTGYLKLQKASANSGITG